MKNIDGVELLLRLMAGDKTVAQDVSDVARRDLEDHLIGPVRDYRATLPPDRRAVKYGPEATAYVDRAVNAGPMIAHGLILGLVEMIVTSAPLPPRANDLDLAAVQAERDDLRVRLDRQSKRLADKLVENRRLAETLATEENDATDLRRRLAEALRENTKLNAEVIRMGADLLEAQGDRETLEEKLAAAVNGKIEEARGC